MSLGNATASGAMDSALWAQVAQPSVLVHSVVPAITRMMPPATTAWRYGLVTSPLVNRQQSRQLDPSVARSRDPVRSQPPLVVRCIWRIDSCSARAGPVGPGPWKVGPGDCGRVEPVGTGEGVVLARATALGEPLDPDAARKLAQAPAPTIPATIATMATAPMAKLRHVRRPRRARSPCSSSSLDGIGLASDEAAYQRRSSVSSSPWTGRSRRSFIADPLAFCARGLPRTARRSPR